MKDPIQFKTSVKFSPTEVEFGKWTLGMRGTGNKTIILSYEELFEICDEYKRLKAGGFL